jgi:hypothetical protein
MRACSRLIGGVSVSVEYITFIFRVKHRDAQILGHQIAGAIKFCTVTPRIWRSSV